MFEPSDKLRNLCEYNKAFYLPADKRPSVKNSYEAVKNAMFRRISAPLIQTARSFSFSMLAVLAEDNFVGLGGFQHA
jgi:hypothetical protein